MSNLWGVIIERIAFVCIVGVISGLASITMGIINVVPNGVPIGLSTIGVFGFLWLIITLLNRKYYWY